MSTLLVLTKLKSPPIKENLLPRPHLNKKLERGLNRKLTLLTAPAGFGKTTLLIQWLENIKRDYGWISLDTGDNSPKKFLSYLLLSLENLAPSFGDTLSRSVNSISLPDPEMLVTRILNQFSMISMPLLVILDDYHHISNPNTHELVYQLIELSPPRIHFVISSREMPNWPLARLRANQQINEIIGSNLLLTLEETQYLINSQLNLNLNAEELHTLYNKTEGWMAGLQMAAISLQDKPDKMEFLKTFSGSNRYILDYLVEEVFEQNRPDIQEFLLKTSILRRMNEDLCNHLTGRSDSQTVLIALEKSNVFINFLDENRLWYQYHHLFAELLQTLLKNRCPEEIASLHVRASNWFEANHLIYESLQHAFAAQDYQRIAEIMENNPAMLRKQGGVELVNLHYHQIPDFILKSNPWFATARAWELADRMEIEKIPNALDEARQALSHYQADKDRLSLVECYLKTAEAYYANWVGDFEQAHTLAQAAYSILPHDDIEFQAAVTRFFARSFLALGQPAKSIEILETLISSGQLDSTPEEHILILSDLIASQLTCGQLKMAEISASKALDILTDKIHSDIEGILSFRVSHIKRMLYDLDSAEKHAKRFLEISQFWGYKANLHLAYRNLCRVMFSKGDLAGALDAIEKAETFFADSPSFWQLVVSTVKIYVLLASGELETAAEWLAHLEVDLEDIYEFKYREIYLVAAKTMIALGIQGNTAQLERALEVLLKLEMMAKETQANALLVSIQIQKALIHHELGSSSQTIENIFAALALAAPENYLEVFIREGIWMYKLLQKIKPEGSIKRFVEKILKEIRKNYPMDDLLVGIEIPLTDRELEVLRYFKTGKPLEQIAQDMGISINTLRTHTKSIYNKLGVHSRRKAEKRAAQLGII